MESLDQLDRADAKFKLDQLQKPELDRQLNIQCPKGNPERSIDAKNEIDYFDQNFREEQNEILYLIGKSSDIAKEKLSTHFDNVSIQILLLQKYVASISDLFSQNSNFVIKAYQKSIQDLNDQMNDINMRMRLMPKNKFEFTSKRNDQVSDNDSVDSQTNGDAWHVGKIVLGENLSGFRNEEGKRLTFTSEEILNKDVRLSNLTNCTVHIHGAPSTLHMSNINNCEIFTGPVSTPIVADNCVDSRFVIGGQQLRLDSSNTENLYRKVRGIINKLTPEKFNTLLNQMKKLPIDTSERLQGVIDLIFEKAVDEPKFAMVYAYMCKELAPMQVPISAENKEFINFRKLFLTRCQIEFEKTLSLSEESNRRERMKVIESCTDPEKKQDLMALLIEDDHRTGLRAVGNIVFIGELFKQQMYTTNIMLNSMLRCSQNLIESENEGRLECLCKLLTTVGHELEKKIVDVSGIFSQMAAIVDRKEGKGKVSSKVRFMLQDVIDLRKGGWVPRSNDIILKTTDQILRENYAEHIKNFPAMGAMNANTQKSRKTNANTYSDLCLREIYPDRLLELPVSALSLHC